MRIMEVIELPSQIQKLLEEAKNTLERSISDYYKYNVCAIIVDEDNNIFKGVNWEPVNGKTVCGEVGAMSAYVISERKKIKYVIIYGSPEGKSLKEDAFCVPCGSCRQRLNEFCEERTIFYCANEKGNKVQITNMKELLPYSFNKSNLE